MSASSAKSLPDLATLAKASGLNKDVFAYLQETGIVNSGVLYHMFVKRDNSAQHLSPLSNGVKVAGADVRLDAPELMIAQAVLEHMCDEVQLARAAQFAATAPTDSVPSTSTATSSDRSKAPKTLPKNYWADMVADYESVTINGQPRKFPAHLLLGAEEVLARMVHEHQTSKIFTPVRLGEIIAVRNLLPRDRYIRGQRTRTNLNAFCWRRADLFVSQGQFQNCRRP